MSGIVDVRHAVPYRVVPRRARNERLVFGPGVTPVAVREVPAGSMVMAGRVGVRAVHAFEGSTWARLGGDHPYPWAAVEGILRGDPGFQRNEYEDVYNHLLGTPVIPHVDAEPPRRGDFDPATAREVLWDGTEAAARGVARFVGEDLVRAPEGTYARLTGPVTLFTVSTDRIGQSSANLFPRGWYQACKGAIPEDAVRVRHVLETMLPDVVNRQTLPEHVVTRTPGGPGDPDMVLLANALPGSLLAWFSVLCKADVQGGGDLAAEGATLRRWQALGRVSGVEGPMVGEALDETRDVLSRVLAARPAVLSHWEVRLADLFLRDVVEPRLHGPSALSVEDEDALGSI